MRSAPGAAPGRGRLWGYDLDQRLSGADALTAHAGASSCIAANQVGLAAASLCARLEAHRYDPLGNVNLKHAEIFAPLTRHPGVTRAIDPREPVWSFVTTDHRGTPILALDSAGATTWLGGFELFGHDWQTGAASATANGVFQRLPGQRVDSIWEDATLGTEVFYNVHRWNEPGTGRLASPDVLNLGHLAS